MKKFSYLLVLATLIAVMGSSCVSSRSNGCPTTNKNFFRGR